MQEPSVRTLDGGFGPHCSESPHRADHEVLEDQIAVRVLITSILAEIRYLGRLAVAHAAERRVERVGCGRYTFAGRGGERAHRQGGERRARKGSQQSARGGGERGHGP
jgi:hypothetical protein